MTTSPTAEPPACLVILNDRWDYHRGTRIDLVKSPMTVGRVPQADITIKLDTISRRHCRFEARDGAWWLVDENSCGGTPVNDEYNNHPVQLVSGDRINLGDLRVRFLAGPDLPARYEQERHDLWAFDAVTRAHSKPYLLKTLSTLCASSTPLALALADVDHLATLNDTHGHHAVDGILKNLAALLQRALPPTDTIARYRGGTFALVMPRRSITDAQTLCETLRTTVAETKFPIWSNTTHLTMSIGIAIADTPESLLTRADNLLLAAKAQGRNRTIT